jgi:hypothetical protein
MNAVICWKEYRQQRAIWLALVVLGVLLTLIPGSIVSPHGIWQVIESGEAEGLGGILALVVLGYGVVCGAVLLAGEKELATLNFLDTLPRRRFALWRAKLIAGLLLTLSQVLLLAVLILSLRLGDWNMAGVFLALGVDALLWGMLGGALCRNVLVASLTGCLLMAASWAIAMVLSSRMLPEYPQQVVALVLFKCFWQHRLVWHPPSCFASRIWPAIGRHAD